MARNGHKKANGGGDLWLQRSYYVVDRDPECDRFQALWQKQRIKESELAMLAGCSAVTVRNMFAGKTRMPRHSTFAKLAGAMGHEYGLKRIKTPDYEKELPKAREEYRAHKEALRKKRESAERAAARRGA